ncbi:MAG: hypothetical protein IBJ12_04020 [Sphingomonadaceae bacterium]|nr:hypothetical protein [Sphingomonadaceae bacterium]
MKPHLAIIAATITFGGLPCTAMAHDGDATARQKEHTIKLCPMPRAPKAIGVTQWRPCRKAYRYSEQSKRAKNDAARIAAEQ